MKLRIKENSVRFRLTRSEVLLLKEKHLVEQETIFANSKLTYSLQANPGIDHLVASFADNKITMHIPESWVDDWADSEKVGFDHHLDTGNGKKLYLLLEKDFKCLDQTTEDQSDNFDNPQLACS